jgi:AAA+ ATPase superfamily predicted ATPase
LKIITTQFLHTTNYQSKEVQVFIGRKRELGLLKEFQKRNTASLIVCRGRRRIGKSTLIQQFGRQSRFFEFWGLAPRENMTNQDQLKHFGELMGQAFDLPAMLFENWNQAFYTLAGLTKKGRTIILFDEISWMASKDKDFAGKLKGAWDTKFKKNTKLILILCGSVTSWIDDNILNDKGFVGRVSATITLDPLSLCECNQFWKNNKTISAQEKIKLLSVTGGVPRYLEEIDTSKTAEQNIKRMCFRKEGLLFSEFDKIFQDIFERRSNSYKKTVQVLADGAKEHNEIAANLGVNPTGSLSGILSNLITSGFIARDYVWSPKSGKKTSRSKFRIRDPYLRFYLKYIEPIQDKIEKGLLHKVNLETLPQWQSIMGLQFESLLLDNLNEIIQQLEIAPESIISASPYFQKKTQRKNACQIDLLIHTRYTLYVCEMKCRSQINKTVITEVMQKIENLPNQSNLSIRPVLAYCGNLVPSVANSGFFANLLPIENFLVC